MKNKHAINLSFSALICVYHKDDPSLFKKAAASILSQSLLPSELVIVVDGPVPVKLSDAIHFVDLKASDFSIPTRIFWKPSNSGHGAARNTGINACFHDIIVLCDADDINLRHRFATLIAEMATEPSLSVVGSDVVEISKNNGCFLGLRSVKQSHDAILRDMAIRCPFNQMTVALRKSHVLAVGGYRSVYNNEDYDLWVRLAYHSRCFRNVAEPLVHATVDDNFFYRRGGIKYFLAELYIQKSLLWYGFASPFRFLVNCLQRFVVQLLLPSPLRKYVFQKFARSPFPIAK